MSGVSSDEVFCVEVFCGKAKLSKHLRNHNFAVFRVDHKSMKHVPVLRIDLSEPCQRQILEDLLQLDKVLYVHFAPPCGTASVKAFWLRVPAAERGFWARLACFVSRAPWHACFCCC